MIDSETAELPKINQKRIPVQTLEDAQTLVKRFWIALGHEIDLSGHGNLIHEITYGDRTSIVKPTYRELGEYTVLFKGNNQPLSKKAIEWLKEQHLL